MNGTLERLRQRRDNGEGGFTLIELLIVIVVLGILAAIVVFAVQNLAGTSAQAACKTDFKTVETAVEAYKAETGSYPTAITDLTGGTNPVLKETPTNTGHYEITVSGSTITVGSDPAGTTYGTDITACASVK